MILVVVDTNVYIHALFHNDRWCREVLNREYNGEIKIAMNIDTYAELSYIIYAHANKFSTKPEKLYKIYGLLGSIFWRMKLVPKITFSDLCEDHSDNKFIDCLIDGDADYIVTHDGNHLLGLEDVIEKRYKKKTKILSAYQFINELNLKRLKTNVNTRRL